MFGFFGGGGWRNASVCKRAVTLLQKHLRDLRDSSVALVEDCTRSRRVARFVSDGDLGSAFTAAERILREENAIRL
ncbi:unnamed protein product [Linum trigynum]|uniref:Uncharacterized protein n=1 Tax=Linum trigynum TaxID=586398 RepID=A0AAV2ELS1_9ROSI